MCKLNTKPKLCKGFLKTVFQPARELIKTLPKNWVWGFDLGHCTMSRLNLVAPTKRESSAASVSRHRPKPIPSFKNEQTVESTHTHTQTLGCNYCKWLGNYENTKKKKIESYTKPKPKASHKTKVKLLRQPVFSSMEYPKKTTKKRKRDELKNTIFIGVEFQEVSVIVWEFSTHEFGRKKYKEQQPQLPS